MEAMTTDDEPMTVPVITRGEILAGRPFPIGVAYKVALEVPASVAGFKPRRGPTRWNDGIGTYFLETSPNSFELRSEFREVLRPAPKPMTPAPAVSPAALSAPVQAAPSRHWYVETASVPAVTRQVALTNAWAAMRELGIEGFQVLFFREATPQEEAAIDRGTYQGRVHERKVEVLGFTYANSHEIWLRADLAPMDMASVAAHEVAHRSRYVEELSREDDEAFAQAYARAYMWRHHRIKY